jgi:hypothetical protein
MGSLYGEDGYEEGGIIVSQVGMKGGGYLIN